MSELTLSECAVLAGITRSPNSYNPLKNPEASRERQELVLGKMLELGCISQAEYEGALADNVYDRIQRDSTPGVEVEVLSYFEDALIYQVLDDLMEQLGYSEEDAWRLIYRGGITIYSTQDTALQSICEEEINRDSWYPADVQSSVVIMDPYTGAVKAIVGGRGEKSGSLTLNRAISSVRQPGSTVKVVGEYAAALDSGEAVANVQELAAYGLEAPKKYITVTSDGVDVVYYLGDQAADGRWYVLTPAGTVRYTSDENKMLLSRSIYAMAVLPVLPVIEPDRLVSVSLLRADGTAAVSFYTAEDGTRRSANRDVTEKTAALADEIAALTLTACVDYDPAEGAAAVCGLDTPEVTLTVNYLADNSAERTLILAVGLSTGDGGRYVALDGDTTIYRMEESSLTQILTLSETGL